MAKAEKRACPGCDRDIKVYYPKLRDGRYDELHFQNHYLNPEGYTNPGNRGDRCANSGCAVAEAIVVPRRTSSPKK